MFHVVEVTHSLGISPHWENLGKAGGSGEIIVSVWTATSTLVQCFAYIPTYAMPMLSTVALANAGEEGCSMW